MLSGTLTKSRISLIAAFLVLIISAPLLIGGTPVWLAITQIAPHWIVAFLMLYIGRWYCVTWRLQLLLSHQSHTLSRWRILHINLICTLADETTFGTATPGVWLYSYSKEGVNGSAAAAAGLTVNALNGIALTLLFPFILVWAWTQTHVAISNTAWLVGLPLLLFGLTSLFIYALFNQRLINFVLRFPVERILPKRLHAGMDELLQKTRQMPLRQLLLVLLLSLINWAIRLSIVYLAILMVGHYLPWAQAALIHFVGAVTGLLIPLPGGFPAADLSITALLSQHFELATCMSIILLWRLMTLYTNIVAGGLALLWLGLRRS